MAIYDRLDTHVAVAFPPAQFTPVNGSIPIDMNPDWGNGPAGQERTAVMLGQTGGDLVWRIDITTAFVAGGGTDPLLQFWIVGAGSPIGTLITVGNEWVTLGSNTGTPTFPSTLAGYNASELGEGEAFFVRVNPWTRSMGRRYDGAAIEAQDIRYFGLVLVCTNYAEAGNPFFSAGTAQAHMCNASDIAWDPKDFTYPSGTFIK